MKSMLKLLALLLALIMTLSSCTIGSFDIGGSLGGEEQSEGGIFGGIFDDLFGGLFGDDSDESETVGSTVEESVATTEEQTTDKVEPETAVTTKPEDTEPEETTESYRSKISKSREELEALITISEDDFTSARDKLNAFNELAITSSNYDEVDAAYMEFEDAFIHISTQITLANIVYYTNMSDDEASDRYLTNYDKYGDLYNEYIEVCKNAYNNSPIKDELFADWTEEDIEELFSYDPEMQELRQKVEELQVEINDLNSAEQYDRSAEIYAEIVTTNNKLAKLCGYNNYYEYASVEVYGRDYTVEDIAQFRSNIIHYFVPNMDSVYNKWYNTFAGLSYNGQQAMIDFLYEPFDTLDKNYLEGYINSYDNSTGEGFSHMFENRNMIFANSRNSHQSAFQTYLEELETPFCLFGSEGQNTSSIAHEMGHYYAALYNSDVTSMDLAETQSQANEFLLLRYMQDNMPRSTYNALMGYNVYLFVLQSVICVIIDEFEYRVYTLESVEGYGSAEFDAIMAEVCEQYGGIDYINENVTNVNDYWRSVAPNSPVYYISYATSMVEALNIFAIASADQDKGREMYRQLCEEVDENDGFKEALTKVGLTSPFDEETFKAIFPFVK